MVWTIVDIKGLSPSNCMDKILMEDECKPSRDALRRLNLPMMEVVKKEILKLVDVGMIYLISDRKWMSPVGQEISLLLFRRVFWFSPIPNGTGRPRKRQPLHVHLTLLHTGEIHSDCVMFSLLSNIVWIIKYLSKIIRPLRHILQKEVDFDFHEACKEAFEKLADLLTFAPIIQEPNWDLTFEIMCDARNYAIGFVLGQKNGKASHVIYHASRTLDNVQSNYSTTEKELLTIVFALENFKQYIIGSKVIVYSDHANLKFLMTKKDVKTRLIWWILL
uniref:Reverse transcriptase RNase H-like domain-containing protein n=1 Tax=Lactuca sativa TaxID=4236 RepID=A0A9R1W1I4_LACSA|nr:hypothetical protein LSAT_V11C300101380 [Lactuca sativa]